MTVLILDSAATRGSCSHSNANPKDNQSIDEVTEEQQPSKSDKALCDQITAEEIAASQQELDEMCNRAHQLQITSRDEEGAIELYKQVVERNREHVRALSCLGALYHKRGSLDEARRCYDSVLAAHPDRYNTLYNLGRLAHEQGSHAEAEKCYERALHLAADDTIACNAAAYLGLLHQEVHKDFDKARQCYAASLERNPDHLRTLDHQSALLVLTGRCDEARVLHARILEKDPRHSQRMSAYLSSLFDGGLLDSSSSSCSISSSGGGRPSPRPSQPLSSLSSSAPTRPAVEPAHYRNHSNFLRRAASKLKGMMPGKASCEQSDSRKLEISARASPLR